MRGTTLALRFVLTGEIATDWDGEFLDLGSRRVHVFDCFALVNRLLCAAHVPGTSQGRPSTTMFGNCERHLAATLSILAPTMVIVQGRRVWDRTRRTLVPGRQLSRHLFECTFGTRTALVCTFTHPSARSPRGWADPAAPYFREVVRPTLSTALRRM